MSRSYPELFDLPLDEWTLHAEDVGLSIDAELSGSIPMKPFRIADPVNGSNAHVRDRPIANRGDRFPADSFGSAA